MLVTKSKSTFLSVESPALHFSCQRLKATLRTEAFGVFHFENQWKLGTFIIWYLKRTYEKVPGRLTTFWQGHIICIYVIFCQLYLSKQLEFKVRYSIMLVMKAKRMNLLYQEPDKAKNKLSDILREGKGYIPKFPRKINASKLASTC